MARILIVDDEPGNREALQSHLQDENPEWQIFTAKNDTDGLTLIKSRLKSNEPIDVVLIDLELENRKQEGMEMLREARRLDPLIMAILFTAKETSLDRFAAFDYGAFDVVEKTIIGAAANREINVKARAALRYREWSKKINFLRRYFDPKLFETLERDPSVLSIRERTITICFWDIRGFSRLCDNLTHEPELIAGFLKDYFEVAAKTIFEHGGMLDKFIGDGVMALFGVLGEKDDDGQADAVAAVQTAIDLETKFEEVLKRWMSRWAFAADKRSEIGLGCGIVTGKVLVGNVGTDFRDQFTALGPKVNLAARIEAHAKSGQILMSQTTQARVRAAMAVYPAGTISNVKNIPGEFELFATRPVE
jgi:class 3 adenylate cyclase